MILPFVADYVQVGEPKTPPESFTITTHPGDKYVTWAVAEDMPPYKFLDTSRHNHGNPQVPIDFEQVKAAGYVGWCGRASVGNYYIDEWFQRDYDAAKAAGLIVMAYHVTVPVHDDASQVANFMTALGGRQPASVVIDAEWNNTPSSPARCTACNLYHTDAFIDLPWHPRVILYTNQNYGNKYLLTDFGLPLWVASPGVGGTLNLGSPSMPRWWTDYLLHQNNWRRDIPGLPDRTVDSSRWHDYHEPHIYFGVSEEPPMSDPVLLARIIALEERVTVLEGGTPPPPPPVDPPPDAGDTIIVEPDNDKPKANAWFAKSTNAAGRPVMEIYPSDSSLTADRIQFPAGIELAVILPKVKADGGAWFYKLRDRKGRAGETHYVRDVDARLLTS